MVTVLGLVNLLWSARQQIRWQGRCPTCGFSFESQQNLDDHNLTLDHQQKVAGTYVEPKLHQREQRYRCTVCPPGQGRLSTLSWAYKCHYDRHCQQWSHQVNDAKADGLPPPPKPEEKKWSCPFCPNAYLSKGCKVGQGCRCPATFPARIAFFLSVASSSLE